MLYTMCVGEVVGSPDDEKPCTADCHESALRLALAWADESWPDSDGDYGAVVWVECDGAVVALEEVVISASGKRA